MLRIDSRQVIDMERVLAEAGKQAPRVIARTINHAGDRGFTIVKSTLAKQMGLKVGKVAQNLSRRRAYPGRLEYQIVGRGGALSLREFGARQGRRGVSARPWGKRRVFRSTFIVSSLGGHVFKRSGRNRLPIEKMWGPSLAREMVRDSTHEAFEHTVVQRLGDRVAHELARLAVGRR